MQKIYRKPHRYKRKKSVFKNRFFWLGILISIVIGVIFYSLFFSETFQVKKIIVTGEKKVSTEEIKQFIEERLENKILFFPTKSVFLVKTNKIRKDVLNNFPQIAELEIKRGLTDSLNVLVVERLSFAVWCKEENCFLLDNEGVVFEETSPETELTKIIDKQNLITPTSGERVIEKEKLSQIISEIVPEFKTGLKIPIKEFTISSQDKLIILVDEGWEIYFNLEGDIEWQITKLRAVLEEGIPAERRKDLEYIELRFGDLATFRYREK